MTNQTAHIAPETIYTTNQNIMVVKEIEYGVAVYNVYRKGYRNIVFWEAFDNEYDAMEFAKRATKQINMI